MASLSIILRLFAVLRVTPIQPDELQVLVAITDPFPHHVDMAPSMVFLRATLLFGVI